jgi:hypothetical protein
MTPEPTVRVTCYAVSCLPEDHELAPHLSVAVEYRGRGKWAVTHFGQCLNADGEWDYEMRPSARDDDWLSTHRFDLDTALELAKQAVPKLSVNGWTVENVLTRSRAAMSERPLPAPQAPLHFEAQ